jgi:hypothetical protein
MVLLGITALAAYSVGHQDAPANQQPAALAAIARSTAQRVAFTTPAVEQAGAKDQRWLVSAGWVIREGLAIRPLTTTTRMGK